MVACIFDGHKIRGKWRAHDLLQREGMRWRLRGRDKWRGNERQNADAQQREQSSNSHARQSTSKGAGLTN